MDRNITIGRAYCQSECLCDRLMVKQVYVCGGDNISVCVCLSVKVKITHRISGLSHLGSFCTKIFLFVHFYLG